MNTKPRTKSAFYRKAARTEIIEICKSSANLLANMAQMDECVEAICRELDQFVGDGASERVNEAYAKAYEAIRKEVGELLMFRMFDDKAKENI